MEKQKAL